MPQVSWRAHWNQRHLMIVLREYEDFYNTHRPHRTLKQAAPHLASDAKDWRSARDTR